MSKEAAMKIVDDFEGFTFKGAWTKIRDRAKVAAQLRARVDNPDGPYLINQGSSGTCGPATITFNVARGHPADYVTAVTSLFNIGGVSFRKWNLKPCKDLLNAECPTDIAEADWIILASIRDSENWFFDLVPKTRDGYAAGTTLGEIEDWFTDAGYTDVKKNQIYINIQRNTIPNLKESLDLYGRDYQVVWFICADALTSSIPDSISPDHFVVLAGDFTPPGKFTDPVSIPIFTWGRKTKLPEAGGLTYGQFLDQYYGYAAGKF